MSVAVSLQLPEQPSDGNLIFQPLGGDGFTSPQALYLLDEIHVDGDASGGTASVTVNLDPHFQSLVSVMLGGTETSSAATPTELKVNVGGFGFGIAKDAYFFDASNQCSLSWCPPPLFTATQIRGRWPNATGVRFDLSAVIYLFNKEASHKVPLSTLLASLPSASTLFP